MQEIIRQAADAGISLTATDFDQDGQLDGMDPGQWLAAMTMD